jgi:hypothetical protein
MERTLARLRNREPTTIVVTGDSRSVATPWTLGRKNWIEYLHEALWASYGDGFIYMINSCRCGADYCGELERLDTSVLRFRPDLVILGLHFGDGGRGEQGLEDSRDAVRETVARIRAACGSDILFSVNNPVVYGYWEPRPADARPGEVYGGPDGRAERCHEALTEAIAELGLPVCDHYTLWKRHRKPVKHQSSHPQGLWMRMADTIHPGPTGHLALFREIAPFFRVPEYFPWEEVPFEYPED